MGATAVTIWNWVRAFFVVGIALVVQESIMVDIHIDGAHPDVMFLIAVAAGYVAGAGRGPVIAFVAGIGADLFAPTTFGMSALVFALLAYCVAVATFSFVRSSAALQVLTGAVGTAAGLSLYAMLGALLGFPKMIQLQLVPAIAVAVPAAAILAVPAIRSMQWAMSPRTSSVRSPQRARLW
jgi:rod shape-determining protein MreD